MRLTILTLIGAVGLVGAATSAKAAPMIAIPDDQAKSGIVQVWGGCGPGFRPVPGHWSRWRGAWIPPHCAPMRYGYGGGYGAYAGGYGYGGGYPYSQHRYYRWGY